jgi:hypothetical protein
MQHQVRLGTQIYYVPNFDERLAHYVPITRLHLSLAPPLVTLGRHLVIAPKPSPDGSVARDRVGGYWISKAAYETHRARQAQCLWRRLRVALSFASRKKPAGSGRASVTPNTVSLG